MSGHGPTQPQEQESPVSAVSASVENESAAIESSSLDETTSSADLELQHEQSYYQDLRGGSFSSSVMSATSSERLEEPRLAPSALPASTPSKQLEHGIILKQLVLKGITYQLNTAQSKLQSKEATCLTVSTWIGIGTKSGLVLVFDVTQNLKWFLETIDVLGAKATPDNTGESNWCHAISALAFNSDHSRLLVGNARGHILEYDMKDGKLVRTLNDVHPPEAAVLHLKFTESSTLALLVDSGGSVFELGFKRTLGLRGIDTRCLFSGSRGEVCIVEPLRTGGLDSNVVHGLNSKWESSVIIAMATLSKVLVVQIRPSTKVIATQSLNGDGLSPPCLGWHFVAVSSRHRGRSIEPVLAYGRHRELHFVQLSADERKVHCHPLLRFQLDFNLRGLQWLDSRMLALMDSEQQVHVVDIKSRETVDVVDISSVDLVTSAPFFQGLATGGNVSQALALVGASVYYNSVASCAGQLLLLCSSSLRSLCIRPWDERLDLLVSLSRPEDAIRLGLRMLSGKAKAMHGLKGNQDQRKSLLRNKELDILNGYIDGILVPLLAADSQAGGGGRNLKSVIELCVSVYIELDEDALMFEQLFPLVCPVDVARITFLELLEPHFLNDRLPSIPPSVMQQFVAHYEDTGRLEALENCISHVDVTCLDLHQILTLASNQGLYHAYLYVHTRALHDYVSPLEDLMRQLQAAVKLGPPYSEQDLKLGHVVLVYISCCLAGRAYPVGEINEDARLKVKHQVLTSLTCLHSKRAADDEPPYPYLRVLLEFNTQELLNALSLAFEESEFVGEMGARRQQRVIDILVEIMIDSTQFSPDQICSLFTFIARQISRSPSADSIHLDRTLFQQLLDLMCAQSSGNDGQHVQSRFEERQQALLQLLQIKGQPLLDSQDEEKLLVQARSAKFYRVCEYIYERRQDWKMMLECYVEDASRHGDILQFLRRVLTELPSASSMAQMEEAMMKHIQLFVQLSAPNLAVFLAVNKPRLIPKAIEALTPCGREKYRFLAAIVEMSNHEELATRNSDDGDRWIVQYAELMAEFEPEQLTAYVQAVDSHLLPKMLDVCRRFSLVDAEAALLERQGEMTAAYDLLLGRLQDCIGRLFSHENAWDAFQSASQSVFSFCQRQVGLMTEAERERIWLTLLDHLLAPQRAAKGKTDAAHILSGLRDVTQRVVTGLQGQVSLTKVLPRLIEDPETTGGTLGDLRQLLMGLLDNYTYETTLLRISTRLLQGDVHGLLLQRCRQSRKGVALRVERCSLCRHPLQHSSGPSATIAAFQCRHAFHGDCMPADAQLCVLCYPIPIAAQLGMSPPNRAVVHEPSSKLSPSQMESVANVRRRLSSGSCLLPSQLNDSVSSS